MEVQQHLKRKSRGSTEEKRWTTIYMMLFPNAKDLPSPYYLEPAVPPDVAAQSLACHLYNDLPDRILREISEHHGSDHALYMEGKLVNCVVRKSLSAGYKDWLHKQDWPISKPSAASVDTHLDERRWKSDCPESEIKISPPECSGAANKQDVKQNLPTAPDPERPMSTMSATGRMEFVLFQTKLCADWHLRQYQQIPDLQFVGQNANDLFPYSSSYQANFRSRISGMPGNNCEGSTTANFVHHLPEMRDDQGPWYKFYLAVVMLKRNESVVGWRLAKEGCEITKSVIEQPSRSFFPNLYNHFGSHKWDEFESLRLNILRYLKDMSVLLLGANHPLTIILGYLAIEGLLKIVSEPALKIMLDVYEQALDSMHPDVIQTKRSLCKVFRRRNEFCAATDRVKAMLKHSEQVNGRYHTNTRRWVRRLGHLYRYQERYEDAEAMYRDVVELAEKRSDNPGELDDLALCTAHDLVSIAFQADRFDAAESWARLAMAAVVVDSRNMTPENYLVCVLDLHKCLLAQGRVAEARDWMERYSESSDTPPPRESCEEHALLSSISKDHFAWVLAELGHPYLLPDAY
jgi:tetratricopeptide (TPR) repeat protein